MHGPSCWTPLDFHNRVAAAGGVGAQMINKLPPLCTPTSHTKLTNARFWISGCHCQATYSTETEMGSHTRLAYFSTGLTTALKAAPFALRCIDFTWEKTTQSCLLCWWHRWCAISQRALFSVLREKWQNIITNWAMEKIKGTLSGIWMMQRTWH